MLLLNLGCSQKRDYSRLQTQTEQKSVPSHKENTITVTLNPLQIFRNDILFHEHKPFNPEEISINPIKPKDFRKIRSFS